MTKLDLDHLQALCDSATPGPWCARIDSTRPDWHVVYAGLRDVAQVPPWMTTVEADAAFIAAARTALPELIQQCRELESQIHMPRCPFGPQEGPHESYCVCGGDLGIITYQEWAANLCEGRALIKAERDDLKRRVQYLEPQAEDLPRVIAERDAARAEVETWKKRAERYHDLAENAGIACVRAESDRSRSRELVGEREEALARLSYDRDGWRDAANKYRGRVHERDDRIATLESALRQARLLIDPNMVRRVDNLAELFYRDTGIMAPGKSVAPEMAMSQPPDDVRHDQYIKWLHALVAETGAAIDAALADPPEGE
jgi:hypothetical protein